MRMHTGALRAKIERYGNLLIAASLALSGLMPIILTARSDAAQVTNRRVTISNSTPSALGTDYLFEFTFPTEVITQSIKFEFCTTPLSTCTKPTGMDINYTLTAVGTQSWEEATNFAEYTGADAGECDDHNNGTPANSTEYCVTRTDTDPEAVGNKSFQLTTVTNPSIPSGNNTSVYVRIKFYSDATFTLANTVHEGTVAASIVNQLNVTGRVQERLVFCVFALDDTAGSSGTIGTASGNMPTDCTANEASASTSVDIGVIDNLAIVRAPVDNSPPASLGNDRFGAALVNTNAASGVAITYYAAAATTGTNELRAFRVGGTTCDVSGTSLVDQCFVSADDAAGEAITAGTERFGMQIACVANSTTAAGIGTTSNLGKDGTGTYVSGSGSGGSYNAVYDAGRTTSIDDVTATDNCENNPGTILNDEYGWRDSATAQALISSTTVVDDELLKFRHGATANATTPTGTYSVASIFIATPTF